MTSKIIRNLCLIAIVLGGWTAPLTAAAQTGNTFIITQVDATAFPTVQFRLRAIDDLSNQPLTNWNANNLTVFEDGESMPNVQVAPAVDGPLNVIFVVDQGRVANYNNFGLPNIRQAISALVDKGYFRDGVDRVQVLGRQNINSDQTVELLPPTQTGADLTRWVANFNFAKSSKSTKGLLGIEDAITRMSSLTAPAPLGSETTAIIFITRYVEDPSNQVAITAAQNTVALAKQNHISIHVFQTDFSQTNNQPLQVLTTGTFGQFVALNRNTVLSQVDPVYQSLSNQRSYYQVTYTSTSGTSGKRQITINNPDKLPADIAGAYDIVVNPVTLTLVEPAADSVIRREAKSSGGTTAFDVSAVKVRVNLNWVDHPRALTTAELYVNGSLESTLPGVSAGTAQLEFDWDFSDISKQGLNAVQLEVRTVDELGVTADASSALQIEVILPPPTPTPTATPTPTPAPLLPSGLTQSGPIVAIVCVLLAAMVAFGAVMAFILRPKGGSVSQALPKVKVPAAANQVTLIGGVPQSATLMVVDGPPALLNQTLPLTKPETKLGRNPAMADMVFYPDEPSSVSRLHCTITNQFGSYAITDNNSSSGTQVNGQRLAGGTPAPLADGADIVLGDLSRRGVRLRFTLGSGGGGPAGGVSSDKTFIFNPGQDQNWDQPNFS